MSSPEVCHVKNQPLRVTLMFTSTHKPPYATININCVLSERESPCPVNIVNFQFTTVSFIVAELYHTGFCRCTTYWKNLISYTDLVSYTVSTHVPCCSSLFTLQHLQYSVFSTSPYVQPTSSISHSPPTVPLIHFCFKTKAERGVDF